MRSYEGQVAITEDWVNDAQTIERRKREKGRKVGMLESLVLSQMHAHP